MFSSKVLNENREYVLSAYKAAETRFRYKCISKDENSTEQYIYRNQMEDAINISDIFYKNCIGNNNIKVVSIVKRTKVGMDGLMIEIAKHMTTHPDDEFCLLHENVKFITGMSNLSWEKDMKDKIPECFRNNVYHHGKLKQLQKTLNNVTNTLFIVDEIDTGDKEDQKLHNVLNDSGVLDIKYMDEKNIRFIFVSATIKNTLKELEKWGDRHECYTMTIPDSYIGHKEFLEMGIIQEYYKIDTIEVAEKWIKEDIIDNYGSDFRVHIIRTDIRKVDCIREACIRSNILFKNHTSSDRISYDDLTQIFGTTMTKHIVIIIKGFWRRANLILNEWKIKIGATHEMYTLKPDENVQVQGLPGRMGGYWRNVLINNNGERTEFKTGPYRTSIKSIVSYEQFYSKLSGNITENIVDNDLQQKKLFLNPKCIKNLEVVNTRNELSEAEKQAKEAEKQAKEAEKQAKEAEKQAKKVEKEAKKVEKEAKKVEKEAKKVEKEAKTEKEDKCKRIPIVIEDLTEDDMKLLINKNKETSQNHLFSKINDEILIKFMKTNKYTQFTHPKEDNSYKKHISDLVNAKMKNNKFTVDLKKEDKDKNGWQAFIDSRENRICILVWCIDDSYP
jgi:flagellar biosynthesis GTPase FlhF